MIKCVWQPESEKWSAYMSELLAVNLLALLLMQLQHSYHGLLTCPIPEQSGQHGENLLLWELLESADSCEQPGSTDVS